MTYLSHPAVVLSESDDTVYKFRLTGCAWVLVYQCLVLALPIFKLLHLPKVGNWSWLWVTLPMWGPSALLLCILAWERATELPTLRAEVSAQG